MEHAVILYERNLTAESRTACRHSFRRLRQSFSAGARWRRTQSKTQSQKKRLKFVVATLRLCVHFLCGFA
jgi:hypothetical protein